MKLVARISLATAQLVSLWNCPYAKSPPPPNRPRPFLPRSGTDETVVQVLDNPSLRRGSASWFVVSSSSSKGKIKIGVRDLGGHPE